MVTDTGPFERGRVKPFKKRSIKVYELYPTIGGFSNSIENYGGKIVGIAAVSIKQAYYFAHNDLWAEDPENPAGVLWHFDRTREFRGLPSVKHWNGELNHIDGPRYGAGITKIREYMNKQEKSDDG